METQRSLDLDVFQTNEVREILAFTSYTYTDEYESSPADEYGMWPATMTAYATTGKLELSLGVVSSISQFNEIKPNLDAIENYVKQFVSSEYSDLKDLIITEVNIKFKVRENFDLNKYVPQALMVKQ